MLPAFNPNNFLFILHIIKIFKIIFLMTLIKGIILN
ncbi:uncharacterized protein METZ01_LOCUS478836, partial [marine metagenome]